MNPMNSRSRWVDVCLAGFLLCVLIAPDGTPVPASEPGRNAAKGASPIIKVVEGGESRVRPEDCLGTIVGPGINQPDPFPGYERFCRLGFTDPAQERRLLVGFAPATGTPLHRRRCDSPRDDRGVSQDRFAAGIVAPTGGRAMIVRSTDGGKTWGKPTTLLDTPDDDRHPAFVELADGTLVCSLFTYPGAEFADFAKHPELAHRTVIIRSFDHGKTWDRQLIRPPSPFLADETDGPMVLLKDGSILLTISGTPKEGGPAQAAVFTSRDRGASWKLLSTIKADHDLDEANAVQLPDGRLVLMARPEGDISWSADQGRTWTAPTTFGMRMFAPSLYVLRDGTLVCLHGSYAPGHGGLRLIFSTDGGTPGSRRRRLTAFSSTTATDTARRRNFPTAPCSSSTRARADIPRPTRRACRSEPSACGSAPTIRVSTCSRHRTADRA